MSDISFSFVHLILKYINSRGIDSESLLEKAGVDPSNLIRAHNKISIESYQAILEEAIHQTEDPCFGLHLGDFFEWRDLSNRRHIMNFGYIMAGCRDLRHAMEKTCEYLGFIGGPYESKIVPKGSRTEILFSHQHSDRLSLPHCIDETLSTYTKIVRSVTNKAIQLIEVRMPYKAPDHTEEYKRIFSCPVLFGQASTALVFHSGDLTTPIVSKSRPLSGQTIPSPNIFYENIEGLEGYSMEIGLLLYEHLQTGGPCIKQVAKDLGMSVRCLQMKLSGEGQTFSQIVKNVRKELAKTYLAEKDCSIDEITARLGFSDPSVFCRAFKSWTGLSPGKYRNTAQ